MVGALHPSVFAFSVYFHLSENLVCCTKIAVSAVANLFLLGGVQPLVTGYG